MDSELRPVVDEKRCVGCGKCLECVKACQFGLNPMKGKIYPLCHNCGDCIAACENNKRQGQTTFVQVLTDRAHFRSMAFVKIIYLKRQSKAGEQFMSTETTL